MQSGNRWRFEVSLRSVRCEHRSYRID